MLQNLLILPKSIRKKDQQFQSNPKRKRRQTKRMVSLCFVELLTLCMTVTLVLTNSLVFSFANQQPAPNNNMPSRTNLLSNEPPSIQSLFVSITMYLKLTIIIENVYFLVNILTKLKQLMGFMIYYNL